MPYYKFEDNDLIYNRIKTHPKVEFTIVRGPGDTNSKVYYNNRPESSGAFGLGTPESGHVDLYELNVDKLSGSNNLRYPFMVKGGQMESFSTVSSTGFHGMQYGDQITGSYPLTASIQRIYYRENDSRKHVFALKSLLNKAGVQNPHYAFTGSDASIGTWDKSTQEMNVIDVPSIFFGSGIKKGTINLRYYISGTLAGELSDVKHNGELIQIGPTGSNGSGSVAGVVLYDAGIFLLTGSWDVDTIERNYRSAGSGDLTTSQWLNFGYGIPTRTLQESDEGTLEGESQVVNKVLQYVDTSGDSVTGSHYSISFQGTNYIPTVTMFARAPKNHLNHSNNPTYIAHSSSWSASGSVPTITGSTIFRESEKREINNIAYSEYNSITGSYKKTTYITEVKLYDKDMNCIGVAKLAKPVKKTPERDFTFKLKVDF